MKTRVVSTWVVLCLLAGIALAAGPAVEPPPEVRWLGPEGEPLPFRTDDEVLDYLRTADIVRTKVLDSGSTKPLKLYLEKDGVRANAIFRTIEVTTKASSSRSSRNLFRDSYVFEVAAFEVSRMLGLDNVPPATLRKLDGRQGSIQLWVEEARSETERIEQGDRTVRAGHLNFQKQVMKVFDSLIYNFDRNTGNMLVDGDGKLWLVDHTRSFKRKPRLPNEDKIIVCERDVWQHLRSLDAATLRQRLHPYLGAMEINALIERHQQLVQRLEQRIEEQGEDAVLFDLVT